MAKVFKLDEMMGKSEPVVTLDVKGKEYGIKAMKFMPEATFSRVVQVNANYEAVSQEVRSNVAAIDSEIQTAGTDVARIAGLNAKRIAEESKLFRPVRELLEAMAEMPDGTLSEYPPLVLSEIFSEVAEEVFPAPAKEEEQVAPLVEDTLIQEEAIPPELPADQPVAYPTEPVVEPAAGTPVTEPVVETTTQVEMAPEPAIPEEAAVEPVSPEAVAAEVAEPVAEPVVEEATAEATPVEPVKQNPPIGTETPTDTLSGS